MAGAGAQEVVDTEAASREVKAGADKGRSKEGEGEEGLGREVGECRERAGEARIVLMDREEDGAEEENNILKH